MNWAHRVDIDIDLTRSPLSIAKELLARINDLKISKSYSIHNKILLKDDLHDPSLLPFPMLPAVAIPVENKQEYECPQEHSDVLKSCISEVTKIIMIGWRASENDFLQLLRGNLRKGVAVLSVAGGAVSSQESIQKLRDAGIDVGDQVSSQHGFTESVLQHEAQRFLRDRHK